MKPLNLEIDVDLPAHLKVKIKPEKPIIKSNGTTKQVKRTNFHHKKKHN